jgi:dihydroorotate dehydrogenase electron transfer subunit
MRLATEVARASGASVQVSIEARMACGLGFCHGCATGIVGASEESPLVCVDGPVFGCRWDA